MDAVESLPPRPLNEAELALLNRADPVTLAVAVEERRAEDRETPDEQNPTDGRTVGDDRDDTRAVGDGDDTAATNDRDGTEAVDDRDDTAATDDRNETEAVDDRNETEAVDDRDGTEAVSDRERSDGVLVATDSEVVGLALVDGSWTVVDRVGYGDGVKRYDALRSCESAVRHALE